MKNLIKLTAVLTVVAVVLGVLLGWGGERRPVVTAQALPCVEMGEQLVCFDGQPAGDMRCENVDPSTVLCTRS
ncbi:MAG TPA: hypothetical protein PK668_23015 [Myxococcota bacterium]|nr:hypothetical protein [Myxococcota bacterium]HRY95567.1 hypothetical protein [Myxococcota bacterium]HSA22321.1 hypothetical protein [Myxococcota bacterium]